MLKMVVVMVHISTAEDSKQTQHAAIGLRIGTHPCADTFGAEDPHTSEPVGV